MSDARIIYRVDLAQLKKNIGFIQNCAGNCKIMPVLKYDAYGMGAMEIGSALKEAGAYRFAVATGEEASQVKALGLDVQILGALFPWEIPAAVAEDIICPVDSVEAAREISRESVKQGKTTRIAVKLDTGMGRLGVQLENAVPVIAEIAALPGLHFDSLFSHFAMAAQPDIFFCSLQIERFRQVKAALDARGLVFDHYHHAAGDAAVKVPDAVKAPFDIVRPGGMMYGENFHGDCRQIVELTAKIAQVRSIAPGTSVSYYRLYIANKPRKVAVLAAGYADGIPLSLSNKGRVIIQGQYCPILGRVCMDYTMVDVTDLPEVHPGEEAVLLGKRGETEITVGEWAAMKNTHGHDIWCAIGNRVKREYLH